MRSNKFFTFLMIGMFVLMAISMVAAVDPKTSSGANNIEIKVPEKDVFSVGEVYEFAFHMNNKENGVALTSADTFFCDFHLYDSDGGHIMEERQTQADLIHNYDMEFVPDANNFSEIGDYYYNIYCECVACSIVVGFDDLGGFAEDHLMVTPNGEEGSTSKAVFYVGVLFLLLILFIASIYGASASEQLWTKTGLGGTSYLLMVAITFIAWMMAANFMTSAPFMIEFLRIVFIVLTVAIFPVLIGLFVYGFWMMMRIDEIKKLQEQGYSDTEAAEKVSKRRNI